MTARERIERILRRQPTDRVGLFEVFWTETARRWSAEGHFAKPEMVEDHFGIELRRCRPLDFTANLDLGNVVADENDTTRLGVADGPTNAGRKEEVIEETETTRLVRDGNGAVLRWIKGSSGAPEHVDFLVKDRRAWEEHIRPRLANADNHRRRVNFELYRSMARPDGEYTLLTSINGTSDVTTYEYIDKAIPVEENYFYKIEIPETKEAFGPLQARPPFSAPST